MRISSFTYLTRQGVKNLWRNRMMTLASVGVLTACLLIVGVAVLITENLNQMVRYVESENEFKAFVVKEEDYVAGLLENGTLTVDLSAPEGTNENGQAEETAEETTAEETTADETTVEEKTTADEKVDDAADEEQPAEPTELELAMQQFDWDGFCDNLKRDIEALPNVANVVFVSKDEGIQSMKEQLGDQSELLDDYEGKENPLNDSFTIQVKDLSQLNDTLNQVRKLEGIYTVSAAGSVAKTLTQMRRIVNIAGWALVTALVIVSLVIITNTIRASIFSRRKELHIMAYVGATKSFIRLPFIVEGILLGLISAVIAYAIVSFGYTAVLKMAMEQQSSWLKSAFDTLLSYETIALPLGGFFFGSSIAIGVLGSIISIRTHIKV